jgi:superfamily I DNA and RNA helicase
VETWYGFGVEFLKSRGDPPDFGKATEQPDFWDRVFERVLGHSIPDSWLFDPVIVDEGQDFEPAWFETLRCFVAEDADFIWLEDGEQDIRGADAIQLPEFIGFRADGNYRTPQSIARFVRDVLPVSFEAKNPLPGLGVAMHGYANADDQRKHAGHVIKELVGRGFKHSDIVLLSLKSSRRSAFTDVKRVGNFTLKSFKGTYDLLGNQEFTDGQIQFESIYRFKGQQAPAIILTDLDGDESDTDHWRRLLYSGMTRATVRLEILAARDKPHTKPLFEAAD